MVLPDHGHLITSNEVSMYRYIALVWYQNDASAQRAANALLDTLKSSLRAWKCSLNANGLVIYEKPSDAAPQLTYLLSPGSGMILGRLFANDAESRAVSSSEFAFTAVADTQRGEQWLTRKYWGRYIAFLRGRDDFVKIVRDCSGQIPCYYVERKGVYIVFADIRDISSLGIPFTINDNYLAAFIARQPLHVRDTGLREVQEVLPGEELMVSDSGSTHRIAWEPAALVREPLLKSYCDARATLVSVTENVLSAWASLSQRILLHLSGGLDSAIVLGCLKRFGFADRVICITQFTDGTADDERSYARAAAQMAGVSLIEIPRPSDGRAFVETIRSLPPTPRPDINNTIRSIAVNSINQVATEQRCDTVWTGQGGDQIFLQAHNPYGAADYVLTHGLPVHLPSVAYDSSLVSRESVWSVILQAMSYRLHISGAPPAVSSGSGSRYLARPHNYEPHMPYRGRRERIPPGKHRHIEIFSDLLNRHKPLLGVEEPCETHPLISQPLIEVSLRIPTYYLLRGGRQRAMARDAFSDRVPPSIIKREDKGATPDQARSLLRGGASLLREALLDGTLVGLGIVARPALEGFVLHQETFTADDIFPLFACIAAETWLQQCQANNLRVATA